MIAQHSNETDSSAAKKILDSFEVEKNNFKQVCPIEMLDKLEHPITIKSSVREAV